MTYLGPRIIGNFKPEKNPNKVKVSPREKWEGNSKAHRALIAKLPSCLSGRTPCDPHHLRIKDERGSGLRARDRWALPLTRAEHDLVHGQAFNAKQELAWFKERGIENPYELANSLWKNSGDLKTMTKIVEAYMS